jgi:hypothetical protein
MLKLEEVKPLDSDVGKVPYFKIGKVKGDNERKVDAGGSDIRCLCVCVGGGGQLTNFCVL